MTLAARRKFDLMIVCGVLLLTSYWVVDVVLDSIGARFSFYRIIFDIFFIMLQICIVAVVWHTMKRRRQLEDSLVAERKAALDDKAKTEAILAALHDSVNIIDRDFQIIYQNAAHRELTLGDHLGKYCYHAMARRDQPCDDCAAQKTFRDGSFHRQEKSLLHGDAKLFVEVVTSPLRNAEGEVVAAIQTARDVTQRSLAEEHICQLNDRLRRSARELAAANQDLSAFSYSLSHDLRSPLAQIITATELLSQNFDDGKLDNEHNPFFLKMICQGGERIDQMIQGMLELSRLGQDGIERTEIDLGVMVSETIEQLRQNDGNRVVTVTVAPALVVLADQPLMRIAVQNLVENAWKYTAQRAEARIEIGVEAREGEEVFFVRDNGVGFNPALSKRLFIPFQRLHDIKSFAGDGIGLSTVQRIVQRHGGRIWAESVEGEGATFYFTLEPADFCD